MAKLSKINAQKAAAEAHKARMAQAKARRREEPSLERAVATKLVKPTMLIYCEGENTEPSYFNHFKLSSMTVKAFGEGKNTVSLVERAKQINEDKGFDEVWCVFDADPKPDNAYQAPNFNQAVALCHKYGFGAAYSNQAFEYWLLLHFEDHQGGSMLRTDYEAKLNGYLAPYHIVYDGSGSKLVSLEIFKRLFEQVRLDKDGKPVTRCDLASERAQRIYEVIHGGNHANPASEESSTTVYQLVNRLRAIWRS